MKKVWLSLMLLFFLAGQAFCQTAREDLEQGNIFLHQNRKLQAEGQYLKALEKDPQLGEAHENLAGIYLARKNFTKAAAHYQAAIGLQRNNPENYVQLALCRQRTGNVDQAIETYLALIKQYPDLPEAYLGLGGLYDSQGLKDKAEAAYATYRALRH